MISGVPPPNGRGATTRYRGLNAYIVHYQPHLRGGGGGLVPANSLLSGRGCCTLQAQVFEIAGHCALSKASFMMQLIDLLPMNTFHVCALLGSMQLQAGFLEE